MQLELFGTCTVRVAELRLLIQGFPAAIWKPEGLPLIQYEHWDTPPTKLLLMCGETHDYVSSWQKQRWSHSREAALPVQRCDQPSSQAALQVICFPRRSGEAEQVWALLTRQVVHKLLQYGVVRVIAHSMVNLVKHQHPNTGHLRSKRTQEKEGLSMRDTSHEQDPCAKGRRPGHEHAAHKPCACTADLAMFADNALFPAAAFTFPSLHTSGVILKPKRCAAGTRDLLHCSHIQRPR